MQSTIELWYVELAFNNNNSPAYVDMINEMSRIGNGIFSATIKVNDGNICDLMTIENDTFTDDYVKPSSTKTNSIPRPKR